MRSGNSVSGGKRKGRFAPLLACTLVPAPSARRPSPLKEPPKRVLTSATLADFAAHTTGPFEPTRVHMSISAVLSAPSTIKTHPAHRRGLLVGSPPHIMRISGHGGALSVRRASNREPLPLQRRNVQRCCQNSR